MPLSCSAAWAEHSCPSQGATPDACTKYEEHCVKVPLVTNTWACFRFCPVPKKWPWKRGSSVNFWEYKLTKSKQQCPLRKTDPYMSPPCCLCFVPCLLQPWHLCPGTAITGWTPPSYSGWHRGVSPGGKMWESAPYAACAEYRNWGGFGCGLQTTMQSHFQTSNARLSLSRNAKSLVAWQQAEIPRQCPTQAGWIPMPLLCPWHRACRALCGSPLEAGEGGTRLWASCSPGWCPWDPLAPEVVQEAVDPQHHMWANSILHNLQTWKYLWSQPERCNI